MNLHSLEGDHAKLSDEAALFSGDILATGFYAGALSEASRAGTIVVVGAGPVGLCCALAAGVSKPARVLLLDSDPQRIAFADELGLEAVDVSDRDPQAAIRERTDGAMADVVIEAVGAPEAFRSAMRCTRAGGRVVVVGVYGSERYELAMGNTWVRGLDLRFSGMANIQAHWDETLTAVGNGAVDPTSLITHRLSLEDAEEGYELFASRVAMKVVLTP